MIDNVYAGIMAHTSSSFSLKDNPPHKDLTTDECERIVVMLLVEEILNPRVVATKFS